MIERICRVSGNKFQIEKEDLEFYAKMGVISELDLKNLLSGTITNCPGLPSLCPEERQRRRLAWRHGGELFKIICSGTKKEIISMYSNEREFPIYEQRYWWSDSWSALDYGQKFDFKKSFFEQFEEFQKKVPRISLVNTNSLNSYYTSHALNQKNCYRITGGANNEDCLYGFFIQDGKDLVDSFSLVGCELCFAGDSSINCYESIYFSNCRNCSTCSFVKDCYSCRNCIACVGLKQKEYHILNKPYSKEEYKKIKASFNFGKQGELEKIVRKFDELKKNAQHPLSHMYNCKDCTGEMLFNCYKCVNCFDCKKSENCKYLYFTPNGVNSYDCSFSAPLGVQFSYENVSTLGNNMIGNMMNWYSSDCFYSLECHNSQNLFGCIGLRKKQYCILNKQYSKEEYFELKEKIIEHMKKSGEWGEFFPISLSPYDYFGSAAQEYFPLTKEAAKERGYKWKEEDKKNYQPQSYKIPEDIKNVPDSICTEILACERTGKNYQIQKAELKFYRKMNLPIPRLHPDERHKDRMKLRNPRKLWKRNCGDCNKEIQTTFAPERPEKILCEDCYLKVVD